MQLLICVLQIISYHIIIILATLFVMHVYKSLEVNMLKSIFTREHITESEKI